MKAIPIEEWASRVIGGEQFGREQAEVLAAANGGELDDLLNGANRIREHFFGRRVRFCSIAAGKLGGCGEDCAWCGQSARYQAGSAPATRPADPDTLVEVAGKARESGASCFCLVNSGRRPGDGDLAFLEEVNGRFRAAGLPAACASMGELDEAAARRLGATGVTRYNHNLETSRSYYHRVVTTHAYEDRLATLRAARSAGMSLCCGGIFGIGETWQDRIELALTLRDTVKPEVVPLNFLDPRPGTPLADRSGLTPRECLHIIALFRFLLPATEIKIAGGRVRNLRDMQSWVFHAGATSLMVGNYLTTCGRDVQEDRQMVEDLGLVLDDGHSAASVEQPLGATSSVR